MLPIIALSIVLGVAAGIGFALLLVPGIYVYARWGLFLPAIVIEDGSYGALARSSELTKEYRWPIVGAYVVFGIAMLLMLLSMSMLLGFVLVGLADTMDTTALLIVTAIVESVFSAAMLGLSSCVVVALYMRLRDIKEGPGAEQLADVFG
ncbi:glycerophosphoryl diester phosphodiesterase membrane domain-containing protein [Methylobrevis pamukkalensis]|uniref:Glycerophosphoryl diester phosphodiesterase membrane domain-containing protein n=1 Tax=Methylobrevis pamukkalensis TaxID=1439726 RepID=A0A1E3GZG5_9HYPH|nr:glycerophosphoryl diester phosphodiesterase membrane domain-containing protein [Methylobrevis pamukkalensis]ODN69469.1 hypothetical protein A6302_03236 [Methylobrevis pamukkalensis]